MRPILIAVLLLVCQNLSAQSPLLDAYIQKGLQQNQALKEQNFQTDKAWAALQESKALFSPTVYIQSDYTAAVGGRKINFPIGDLLNPVYSTLNQITQRAAFPSLSNQSIQFLPNDFHDTRLRMSMPLVNLEILRNKQIHQKAIDQKTAERKAYQRELIKDIRVAYFRYCQSVEGVKVYASAANILKEQYALTASLVKNQLAVKSQLLKIEALLADNESQRIEMENKRKMAAFYFNFLINEPANSPIEIDTTINYSWSALLGNAKGEREEISALKSGITQTERLIKLRQSANLPSLGGFLDAGYQGFGFKFDSDQAYVLGGFQVKVPLFAGFKNTALIKQARLDKTILENKLSQVERQLELADQQSELDVNTAENQLKSLILAEKANAEFYRNTDSRYRQGQALVLELTDAFQQWTISRLQLQLGKYNLAIKQAEKARTAAQEPIQ